MLLGIDIGTSGVKAALVDPDKGVLQTHLEHHDILTPHAGWAEQNPDVWVGKARECVGSVTGGKSIRAVSFSGQMHGIVVIDRNGRPLRNAIIWADCRSHNEINEAMETVGGDWFRSRTLNNLAAGFGLSSLLWLRKHEPHVLQQAHAVLCVKDYVRLRMGGILAQDESDASGTCCLDVQKGVWAADLLEKLKIPVELFPTLGRSVDPAGEVTAEGAKLSGLAAGTPLYFGGGDQGVASIGSGIAAKGILGSNIGTGGQVTTCLDSPLHDHRYRTSTFRHSIPGCYTMFGAILSAGLALKWLKNTCFPSLSFDEMGALAEKARPGCNGLYFLPYLSGERTPHLDPLARGMFWGLNLGHGAADLIRAVMEGVCFALRESYEIMLEAGVAADHIIALGGGSRSPFWMRLQADMYGIPVKASGGGDACLGAAILAGVGCGEYADVYEGVGRLVKEGEQVFQPDVEAHKIYTDKFPFFKEIYLANRELFHNAV